MYYVRSARNSKAIVQTLPFCSLSPFEALCKKFQVLLILVIVFIRSIFKSKNNYTDVFLVVKNNYLSDKIIRSISDQSNSPLRIFSGRSPRMKSSGSPPCGKSLSTSSNFGRSCIKIYAAKSAAS